MERHFARRYRLDPTPEQVGAFERWSDAARLMFNVALEQREYAWSRRGVVVSVYAQQKQITEMLAWSKTDPECAWLNDVPLRVLRGGVMNADMALRRFFMGAGRPRFRSHKAPARFWLGEQAAVVRRLNAKWGTVRVPRMGEVRFRFGRSLDGTIKETTIRRDGKGWYVSFSMVAEVEPFPVPTGPAVGVDRGVTIPAAIAAEDGSEVADLEIVPGLTPKEAERYRRLQQQFARQDEVRKREQRPMSNRQRETLTAMRKLRSREGCRRRDVLDKFTTPLATGHRAIVIEALKVPNMTARGRGKRGLNREILARSWGEMRRELDYKTRWHGSQLLEVNPSYTSQTCAECGHVAAENRRLARFACLGCGHEDHADHNAARNILARGLNGHAVGSTVSGRGDLAAGRSVKRQPFNRVSRGEHENSMSLESTEPVLSPEGNTK